jgi:hypothetical protein
MIARRAASVLCLALTWAASCAPPTGAQEHSLAVREAAFLRTVDRHNTAYVVTGDLVRFTGTHVAYDCGIDSIVQKGLTLSDCGTEAEPMDLFVRMPRPGFTWANESGCSASSSAQPSGRTSWGTPSTTRSSRRSTSNGGRNINRSGGLPKQ